MTPPSWWRAGTLAAAGTTPGRSMGAEAIPGQSQGHHPAGHRPAIPTRAYESGSDGHRRHAAPARHPYPPRPPPALAAPGNPMPAPPDCPGTRRPGVKGACGVAARALRAPVTPGTARVIWQRSRAMGPDRHAPAPHRNPARPSHNDTNQAQEQQKLDGPLHMRSLVRRQFRGQPTGRRPVVPRRPHRRRAGKRTGIHACLRSGQVPGSVCNRPRFDIMVSEHD